MMANLVLLLLVCGELDVVPSPDFSKARQQSAVASTVRIRNGARNAEGSGIILGRKGPFVYILTAQHVIADAKRIEISTFTSASYPKPQRVYREARVIAEASDVRDLALIRLTTDDEMPGSLSLCPARLVPRGKDFKALSVGCSEGKAPTCLVDEVAGKKVVRRQTTDKGATLWEVNRKHLEGRSGGPIVDTRGYLLGVCSGTSREKTWFCHAEEMRAFLRANGLEALSLGKARKGSTGK
jgi:hypothetical protein